MKYENRIMQGDCRKVLPKLADRFADVIITDPVWPNSLKSLKGASRPYELFAEVATHFPRLARTVVIHLGCTSDPRFLMGMPKEMPYLRTCWLRYSFPSYRGRILIGSDVAYVFGEAPKSRKGNRVLSGDNNFMHRQEVDGANLAIKKKMHPAQRHLSHVKWLVEKFSTEGDLIFDPFAGAGTTLVAAKHLNRRYFGIEIEKKYVEKALTRLAQDMLF